MKLKQIKIQEILLKQSYITEADLNAALKASKTGELVAYLIENKLLSKELLAQAIAEFYKLKYYDLNLRPADAKTLAKLPLEFCQQNLTILVEDKDKEKTAIVTTADPEHIETLKPEIEKSLPGKKIEFNYSLDEDIETALTAIKPPLQDRFAKIIRENYYSAPEIFDEIILESLDNKASDIHFEPLPKDNVLIRFRIDGMLREMATIPKMIYEKVLNRIKVLAQMEIDEHYSPQDGSIRIDAKDSSLDLRISVAPTIEGEKTVVRVLSDYIRDLNIEDLGFDKTSSETLLESFKTRHGMILTTGPTGSGKTTTLYAILKMLKTSSVNITTIEDPVEYRIKGVNQIQVDPGHEVTFARGLRSIVRQDPNIILVGEIRDTETAEIAVNAALTGHLLLSTFHANDAATAIPRLIDMGIEPFLLASTVNLIIAQRLLRRICLNCRYSEEVSQEQLKKILGTDPEKYFPNKETRLYKGKGCEKCNFTGYKGRIAILEMIHVTEAIRDLIEKSPSSQDVWNLARTEGARSFFEDGIGKVVLGLTTLEELLRVAPITFDKNTTDEKKKRIK